jgi:hypothetical protein
VVATVERVVVVVSVEPAVLVLKGELAILRTASRAQDTVAREVAADMAVPVPEGMADPRI